MNILTLIGRPLQKPIGPFGLLDLDGGLIFLSILIVAGIVAYRKLKGNSIHLGSSNEQSEKIFPPMDTDILMQRKQSIDADYTNNNLLPFVNIHRLGGFLWVLVLFVVLVLVQALL